MEYKAPEKKEQVMICIEVIELKNQLSAEQKKLLGYILFSYSMRFGPAIFTPIQQAAIEIGVKKELEECAKSRIRKGRKDPSRWN